MDAKFYKSETLTNERLRELLKKSDHPALLKFLIIYTLFIGASAGIVVGWGGPLWLLILSLFVYGLMICSLFACEHETVHNTAFKSLWLNKLVAFLVGTVFMYASTMFRQLHFTHHRHTHEPGLDPEISFGGKAIPSVVSNLPFYMVWLSGLPLFMFKVGMLVWSALGMPEPVRKRMYPFVDPKVRWALMAESAFILAVHTGIILLAIYVNPGFWGFYIGQVVGHCFLASYTAAEHNGLPHEGTIMDKTRSIQANPLVKWLMWNMPYHAEHHAYPGVPFHALPELHKEIASEIKHKDKNHPRFHLYVLKKTTVGEKN